MPCVSVRTSVVRVAFKGAKGASVAGCPCVRVPVRVRVCICAGVACMRDGVRAGGAGVRCVFVPGVGVICAFLLCVRV